ncbi:MATE family efflux transporter [Gephyromycinifex aptenodytis]|uniref:MATE family efflux transporter n=1 Tax=Gephyromycinifex aptenodytis TaxID=2716227 RepID=UPI001D0263A7|nr:MATE family efflux transporter [Gephyromycinifex aptenodytis]
MSNDDTARQVRRLAIPAFLTLIAEPLFLLADTAIIGHLGTTPLAGLAVASAILLTATGIFVFLAYGTTALVSRRLGSGSTSGALAAGIDGLWLSLILGACSGLVLRMAAVPLTAAFDASPAAAEQAVLYLQISAYGVPSMLAVLALTGVLRGLQDTKTPFVASVAAFGSNIVLNFVLVYGLELGIAGSAWGTVIAQTGMALGLGLIVLQRARALKAPLRPHPAGILHAAAGGIPLLVRTLALRGVLLLTTWIAATYGEVPLAAYQVSSTIWSFLVFALDALAIAAQALTGRALGAGDTEGTREMTALMTRWGRWLGVALGLLLAIAAPFLPVLFTTDPAVRSALTVALLVIALGQPIAAHAFVLDGVLIGAGDARWLAWAQVALLVAYIPVIGILAGAKVPIVAAGDGAALAALWVGFLAFMAMRAFLLDRRARTDAWLVTGMA